MRLFIAKQQIHRVYTLHEKEFLSREKHVYTRKLTIRACITSRNARAKVEGLRVRAITRVDRG